MGSLQASPGYRQRKEGSEDMRMLCGIAAMAMIALLAHGGVPAATTEAARQVRAIERACTQPLDRSDPAALVAIMADDVSYVHASGEVDTKHSYLAAIRSGQLHYVPWRPESLSVRVLGDTAVLSGEYAVCVTDTRVRRQLFDVDILILSVCARRDGRWGQISWQSTRRTRAPGPR
jgi:hypothetical protein